MKFYTRLLLSWVCLIIIAVAIPGLAQLDSAANLIDHYEMAYEVFLHSGATIKDIKLQGWGQISNRPESLTGLKEKYETVARRLELDPDRAAVQTEKDGFIGISWLEVRDDEAWQLSMQAVPIPKAPNGGESYAAFLYATKSPQRARGVYSALRLAFKETGLEDSVGVTFSGVIKGDLGAEGRLSLSDSLAALYAGEYVEGITQDNLTSICYYIKQNSKFLPVNGRRINLNIALRYNEQENTTYLYIGAPLIYQDY